MGRHRGFTEDQVLEQSMQQFWSAGYAATSVNELVAVTGLGKGSIYGAFGDKRALFGRALDRYCEQALDAAVAHLQGPDAGAADRLRHYVREAVPDHDETAHPACFLARSAAELAASDIEVRERVGRAFEGLRDALESALVQARRAGDLPSEIGPRQAAHVLLTTLRGVEALREAGVERQILEDAVTGALRSVGLTG